MSKAFTLALILAASASSMTVAAIAADGATEQPTSKKAKPKKICKTSDKITGSRIAKRTCKTEEEWAEAAAKDQELQVKSQNY
jgi:hypothetical protein